MFGVDKQTALYDTGAAVTVMSNSAFMRIPDSVRPTKTVKRPTLLTGADGKRMAVRGCYNIKFRLLGRPVEQDVFVIEDLTSDIILGCDFIHKYNVMYLPSEKKLYFEDRSEWKKGGMVAKRATRIPAGASMAIKVKVQETPGRDVEQGGIAVGTVNCQTFPLGGNDGLVFIRDNGEAFMLIDNMLDADMVIPRGTYIGAVEKIDSFSELEISKEH